MQKVQNKVLLLRPFTSNPRLGMMNDRFHEEKEQAMKIVMLERANVGSDFEMPDFGAFGELTVYDYCKPELVVERIKDADIVIMNKMPMNEATLKDAHNLKLISVTATGTDNVDHEYCQSRGIAVRNAKGYSTETVVQHTFAMFFYLYEHLPFYDTYVKDGSYIKCPTFTYFDNAFRELAGKTWGIVGLGTIGRRVAAVASAFGCRVIYYSTSGVERKEDYERADFETFLKESDVISVHAPLNGATKGLFGAAAFDAMKESAIFLNLGRGPIVDEKDLADALKENKIAGAGLDVLSREPMDENNPLYEIKDSGKLIVTPHIAWASVEARKRLMEEIYRGVKEFVGAFP